MLLGRARRWAIVIFILPFFLGVLDVLRLRIFNRYMLIYVLASKVTLEYSSVGRDVLVNVITTFIYSPFFLFVCYIGKMSCLFIGLNGLLLAQFAYNLRS